MSGDISDGSYKNQQIANYLLWKGRTFMSGLLLKSRQREASPFLVQ